MDKGLHGIVVPFATPFTPDEDLDTERARVLIDNLIDGGVHALIILGDTGEFFTLTPEERLAFTEAAFAYIGGRVPVIIQPSAITTREAVEYKRLMWDELIGRLDEPQAKINPRSRKVYDREKWVGYEVVLDVWPGVIAWGILCVPKDIAPGEKRPVVVCQHGLEGEPRDTIEDTEDGLLYYGRLTARLADRGFVTFAPHNPYRGAYRYMQLQRKANPLKASLGSIILAQHTQIITWLETLPFVDPDRIGFYGLSYGGWTAVRIPPLLQCYCLSICSAAFNDWARKVTSVYHACSYMGYAQFEMVEWNLAHTFSNAEMAYLMVPRPFMVERGMHDMVAPDSWVASEYAKVRWCYAQLGIRDRTEIEFFNGTHFAHGEGTFDFLHRHLRWPKLRSQATSKSASTSGIAETP